MSLKTRRSAFTLVELLTVMAIIVILIGILTPALSESRNRAIKTAIRAQINALSVGLESFRNDQGEYVPSNPVQFANVQAMPDPEMALWEVGSSGQPLQGANLLVDAMVGRDFLGYDPRVQRLGATGGVYDRWNANNDRRQPYISVDGVDVTSETEPPEDREGQYQLDATMQLIDGIRVPVFRDKFGWPILYYRANPTVTQNTPIIQTVAGQLVSDGVYDGQDNAQFTSYMGAGVNPHEIQDANMGLPVANYTNGGDRLTNMFAEFIRSFRATTYDPNNPVDIQFPRPVKSDRFIILSAGRDGAYGTLDDVANFEVFSTER